MEGAEDLEALGGLGRRFSGRVPPRPHESVVRVTVGLSEAKEIRGHVWGLEALGGRLRIDTRGLTRGAGRVDAG